MADTKDSQARLRLPPAAWLGLLAFTVLGIVSFALRIRPVVSLLSTTTHLIIIFAFLTMLLADRSQRPFWMGFVVFSLSYTYLVGGISHREFYSAPAVLAEWAAGPSDLYFEWSRYDYVPYQPGSTAPAQAALRNATRDRVRYIAHCVTAVYLGLLGGYFSQRIAGRAARRDEPSPEG